MLSVLLSGCVLVGYDAAPSDSVEDDGGAGSGGTGASGAGQGGSSGAGAASGASGSHDADVIDDSGAGFDAGPDAAIDGAAGDDGGDDAGTPLTCNGIAEGEACDDGLFCTVGEKCILGVCGGGALQDCSAESGVCQLGVCSELDDACVATRVADDLACGSGLTCQAGACRATVACPPNESCPCVGTECHVECVDHEDCAPVCNVGMTCSTDCSLANECSPTCNAATCPIDCREANSCVVTCASGADCDIDCTGANNCTEVLCATTSQCLLRCDGANNCNFFCQGERKNCPNGVIACNRDCP